MGELEPMPPIIPPPLPPEEIVGEDDKDPPKGVGEAHTVAVL